MKRLMLMLCVSTVTAESPFSRCRDCKPPRDQQGPTANEDSAVIIANFLNMFAQFLQIINNPDNKDIRIAGSLAIAQCIANIATQACKCIELDCAAPDDILEYVEQECEKAQVEITVTQDLINTIKRAYARSALLPQETRARYAEYAEHSDTLND